MKELKGTVALIPTPLSADGKIDEKSLRKLIDYDVENGCSAIGVTAAIGEGYLLSSEEKTKVIKIAADHMQGRGPLIVGEPALGTGQAIDQCRKAQDLGADAILTFNPKFRGRKPYADSELTE